MFYPSRVQCFHPFLISFICQFDAVAVEDGKCHVDRSRCMGCGVCVSHCPDEALQLIRAAEKGAPLEIGDLMAAAVSSSRGPVPAGAG